MAKESKGKPKSSTSTKSAAASKSKSAPASKEAPAKGSKDAGMTTERFLEHAKAIHVQFGEGGELGQVEAKPAQFKAGTLGWKGTAKVKVTIDGVEVVGNVSLNISVPGSKPKAGRSKSNSKKAAAEEVDEEEEDEEE